MIHEYTVETLYHFTCGKCKGWWSYATIPTAIYDVDLHLSSNIDIFCPHCGANERAKIKKGFKGV